MDIQVLIAQMIKLFLLILVGVLLVKMKIINEDFKKRLTKMVIDVTMPCTILASVFDTEEPKEYHTVLFVFALAIGIYILLPIAGFFINYLFRIQKKSRGLYTFMTAFGNVGFMGFPVIASIYDTTAVFYTAIFNIIFNICVFTIGIIMFNHDADEPAPLNLKALLSPGILGSLLAVVLYFIRIPLPDVLTGTINTVGSLTSTLAMLIMGATLGFMSPKELFTDLTANLYSVFRQFLLPIPFALLLHVVVKDPVILGVSFIMVLMPVANVSVLFATERNGDEKTAAKVVFLTTVLSLISTPLLLYLFL